MTEAIPPSAGLRTMLNRAAGEAEDRIARENRRLSQEIRSGLLLAAILLRKLGGEVDITDEELVSAERGTLIEWPQANGYRLAFRGPDQPAGTE